MAILVAAVTAFAAGARTAATSPIDGRWSQTTKATTQELVAHGMPQTDANALARLHIRIPAVDLHAGRTRWFDLATGKTEAAGSYVVRGSRVGFAFSSFRVPTPPGVTWMRWSLYRDRLTFSALPGRSALLPVVLHPWVRVR